VNSTWRGALIVAGSNSLRAGKDRRVTMMVLGLPVLIMLVVGTIFGVDDRTPVGVLDRDGGRRAADLRAYIETTGQMRVRSYSSESRLRSDLRRTRVLAGLIVPEGYTRAIEAGRPTTVQAVNQPGRAESVVARAELAQAIARQGLAIAAERVTGRREAAPGPNRFTVTDYGTAPTDISPYSYTGPSTLVLFVFITSLVLGAALVASRQLRTLQRMLATPTPGRAIALGFAITAYVVALVQAVGLLAVGAVIFRISWGDPIAVVLLLLVLAAVGASLNIIMGTFARTPEQAVAIGVPLGIGLGMLGGCMWPLDAVGPLMRSVGHITPHAWAMDAWVRLIFARQGPAQVGRQLLVLCGFVVVLFPIATWRLRRLVARP
jgi:ABC-2 type transport system permease protein